MSEQTAFDRAGEFIKQSRLGVGLGMRSFAHLCDMLPSHLSDIEHGRTIPTADEQSQMLKVIMGEQKKYALEIRNAALAEAAAVCRERAELHKYSIRYVQKIDCAKAIDKLGGQS